MHKILIIEDEAIIRRMCSRTLTANGYSVDVAGNGLEGLEKLTQFEYDACFSDITMPNLNGIQMYKLVKEKHPHKADCMVFTTGDMLNPEVKEFVHSISSRFLAKPFLPDELLSMIKRIVEANSIPIEERKSQGVD